MRSFVALAAGLALLAVLPACNVSENGYFSRGIGTDVYSTDLPNEAALLDQYTDLICEQADLTGCLQGTLTPAQWMTFVQSGMNDIDRRCDAYLAWLDNVKRSSGPILQEISDARTVTEGILAHVGVGSNPIAIVGAAFGFATSTFTNVTSRLVLEVNHSTVQSLVLTNQNRYRYTLLYGDPSTLPPAAPVVVINRPAAMYILRSYLRLCMPFTIETQINTTVTAVDRGDPPSRAPLVTPATVSRTIISSAIAPLPNGQLTIEERNRAKQIHDTALDAALCVPLTHETRDAAIRDYLIAAKQIASNATIVNLTPKLTLFLNRAVNEVGDCARAGYLNAFEVGLFGIAPKNQRQANIKTLQDNLRIALGLSTADLPSSGLLDKPTRDAIAKLRTKLPLAPQLEGEIDQQFWAKVNS